VMQLRASRLAAEEAERTREEQQRSADLFSTIDTWRSGRKLGWREWAVLALTAGWVLWLLFWGERDLSLASKISILFLMLIIYAVAYLVSAVRK
jgi:hypothetical protein